METEGWESSSGLSGEMLKADGEMVLQWLVDLDEWECSNGLCSHKSRQEV